MLLWAFYGNALLFLSRSKKKKKKGNVQKACELTLLVTFGENAPFFQERIPPSSIVVLV